MAALEITFIRRPGLIDAANSAEFLDVLATAAGNPPPKYSGAEVRIMSDNLSARQAREALEQLVSAESMTGR